MTSTDGPHTLLTGDPVLGHGQRRKVLQFLNTAAVKRVDINPMGTGCTFGEIDHDFTLRQVQLAVALPFERERRTLYKPFAAATASAANDRLGQENLTCEMQD
ncbi:MAG: hypothetical protein M3O31_01810 [Acidobacteriota bacterium]|nr:hypothetical protein [Acidobacteriota bacterium]